MRWTRKGIIEEIKRLHAGGAALNYASAQAEHLNLVRAAAWHFGTWRQAVEKAGIPYEDISKYRRWNRERIIARVRQLHEAGADLSWRTVSTQTDPPLAAAALRPNGFGSWREAIAAAGLDINRLARYRHWDEERVKNEIKALHRARVPLSSRSAQLANQSLFCAARRRFGSWDAALQYAGFSAHEIRLRRPAHSHAATDAVDSPSSPQLPNALKTRKPRNLNVARTASTSSENRAPEQAHKPQQAHKPTSESARSSRPPTVRTSAIKAAIDDASASQNTVAKAAGAKNKTKHAANQAPETIRTNSRAPERETRKARSSRAASSAKTSRSAKASRSTQAAPEEKRRASVKPDKTATKTRRNGTE